jgi:hypothetical protein
MTKIIGVAGRKRAGKNTAADALVGYEQLAFATPLKLMLATLLRYQGADDELIDRMLEGDLKEVPTPLLAGQTPRYALQRLGTEWGRQQMADSFWVDIALEKAKQVQQAVITDVRFPNEVQAIQDAGGRVIRIERPDRPVGTGEEHSSEVLIDTLDVNVTIVNNGSVDTLHAMMTGFVG